MQETDGFGADGDAIRSWLAKRETYAGESRAGARRAGGPRPRGERIDLRAPARGEGPDAVGLGRDILEALLDDAPPAPSPGPARAATPAPPAPPTAPPTRAVPAADQAPPPEDDASRTRWVEPEELRNAVDASTDVVFPARTGVRTALGVLLLATCAAAVVTTLVAVKLKDETSVVVAGVVGVLVLVVWGLRTGATPTALEISRGRLFVRRGGHTDVVDLASGHTPIAVVGEPGLRGWAVLIERPGTPLLTIDASLVDPYWFTTALYRLRPDLRPVRS